MNQAFNIVFYVSLAAGTFILWKFTKPVALGRRLVIIGCFGWMVLLFSLENGYHYYVRYYWMYNARIFMQEVAEEEKWFGDSATERDEIIGLAFAEPKTLAGSADNVRRARERIKNRSSRTSIQPSTNEVTQ